MLKGFCIPFIIKGHMFSRLQISANYNIDAALSGQDSKCFSHNNLFQMEYHIY